MSDNPFFTTPRSPSRSTNRTDPPPLLASPKKKKKVFQTDRFIPNRTGLDFQAAFTLNSDDALPKYENETLENQLEFKKEKMANNTFNSVLKAEIFGDVAAPLPNQFSSSSTVSSIPSTPQRGTNSRRTPSPEKSSAPQTPPSSASRILSYQDKLLKRPTSSHAMNRDLFSLSPVRRDSQRLLLSPQKKVRPIQRIPYRVLDAPNLQDDFYLNLVDWGNNNRLAVALRNVVYLWDPENNQVEQLCAMEDNDLVTSVAWIAQGEFIAIGSDSGLVEIWDTTKKKCIRTMTGHTHRCTAMSWNYHILSTGSRDKTILHRDVREKPHFTEVVRTHSQEICGLKWNVEENKLCSGGNDNSVFVYDGLNPDPVWHFTEHRAAVKALAWSPHQRGVLATGGGTKDRHIMTWNTLNGNKLTDVDTGSQVCNMVWSTNTNEILSSHGFSKNQLMLWEYPSMEQVASLTGHTFRVLYLALSPDGTSVVSGAADETLRFWKVFDKPKNDSNSRSMLLDAFGKLR